MEQIIERVRQEYTFNPAELKELITIIKALESIGMKEVEVKEELKSYNIYL